MSLVRTPTIGRRHAVAGLTATAASLMLPRGAALAQSKLLATPRQTEGPFYPRDWQGDVDNDLLAATGEAAKAHGQVVHVLGRVLDTSGNPIPDTMVEIWQCDAHGIYRHPNDERPGHMHDPAFQGRGKTATDASGRYRFRTIKPVPYSSRTAHIHFKVGPPAGRELITQMYIFGEPLNTRDFVLNGIRDPQQRDSVIVRLDPADQIEPGALATTFDIVLG